MKSEKGFTLLELMIGALLTGGVFLIAGSGVLLFTRGASSVSRKAQSLVDQTDFKARFASMTASAQDSRKFQHLPIQIPSACGSLPVGAPALRKKINRSFACTDSSDPNVASLVSTGVSSIEFFRDSDGALKAGTINSGSTSVSSFVEAPLRFPAGMLNSSYYVTWPLVNAASPPFLLMRTQTSGFSLNLRYCQPYVSAARANSDCGGTSVTGQRIRVNASNEVVAEQIEGQPFIIYNSKDPSQFVVQVANSVLAYTSGTPPAGVAQQWDIDFRTLQGSTFGSSYFPALGTHGIASTNTWMAQGNFGWGVSNPGSAIYPFPTEVPSANLVSWPVNFRTTQNMLSGVDGHYSSSTDFRPDFVASPIELTALYLAEGQVPLSCPRATSPGAGCPGGLAPPANCPRSCEVHKLVAKSYRQGSGNVDMGIEVVLSDSIDGTLYITRRLGDTVIEAHTDQ
jgi:hypothetical protein